MTLDLRAFSQTGGWFAAVPARDNPCQATFLEDGEDKVEYTVSEITLTRTLRMDESTCSVKLPDFMGNVVAWENT